MKLRTGFGGLLFLCATIVFADENPGREDTGVLMSYIRFEGVRFLLRGIVLTNVDTEEEVPLRMADGRGFLESSSTYESPGEQREGLILQKIPSGSYYISHIDHIYENVPVIKLKKRKDTIDIHSGKITYIGDLTLVRDDIFDSIKVGQKYKPVPETIKLAVEEYEELFSRLDLVMQMPGMDEPVSILRSALGIE